MQMGSVKPSDCIGDGETATIGKGRTPHVIGVATANTCGRIGASGSGSASCCTAAFSPRFT